MGPGHSEELPWLAWVRTAWWPPGWENWLKEEGWELDAANISVAGFKHTRMNIPRDQVCHLYRQTLSSWSQTPIQKSTHGPFSTTLTIGLKPQLLFCLSMQTGPQVTGRWVGTLASLTNASRQPHVFLWFIALVFLSPLELLLAASKVLVGGSSSLLLIFCF
jgi:hypothetical protein